MPKLKFNVTPENAQQWLPEGFKLVVQHGHEGNTPVEERTLPNGKVSPFATLAVIYRVTKVSDEEKEYQPVAMAAALCSPKDNPVRRRGWLMAAGRAVKALYTDRGEVEEHFGVKLPVDTPRVRTTASDLVDAMRENTLKQGTQRAHTDVHTTTMRKGGDGLDEAIVKIVVFLIAFAAVLHAINLIV